MSQGIQSTTVELQAEDQSELLSGLEAIVRLPMLQHRSDAANGLRTSSIISGYPGSPLGGVDLALKQQENVLSEHLGRLVPGVNEELAAAVVWGSQQRSVMNLDHNEGVIGMWYGKSPGVDRCGDVLKHATSMGVATNGGVLMVVGDDPAAKSSSIPNDTRGAFFDAQMPVLAPSSVQDIIELGLHGFALSRFSGLWVGLKVVTDFADGFASAVVEDLIPTPVLPEVKVRGSRWLHVQLPTVNNTVSVKQERDILTGRLEAARRYSAANNLNRVTHDSSTARVGIAASGKAYADLLEALDRLGLDDEAVARADIRILKVAMPYPLAPEVVRDFADGLDEIMVIEEKREFLETFMRDALYGHSHHPRLVGKHDEDGQPFIPAEGDLTADRLVPVLRQRFGRILPSLQLLGSQETNAPGRVRSLPLLPSGPSRMPAFCSGCPHNRSTAGPAGAIVGGGVGCHAIVYLEDRHEDDTILPLTPMGAEGVPWIGAAAFSDHNHMFQNLGDGTFAHSGTLAVRAAVASNVNITFKLLYNSAVAMTGAQEVAGGTTASALTRELESLGVTRTLVVADDPKKYRRGERFAPGVGIWSRERLQEAEQVLAATPGVTVLLYDQRCAAEARRLWKRGKLAEPQTRVVINQAVCEGCGDCQQKSNCLSVLPVDTELGRKTEIHQPSCNHDMTCMNGDCPSFVRILEPVPSEDKRKRRKEWTAPPSDLPSPPAWGGGDTFGVHMVGIGGTGVVTASKVLADAARRDGWVVNGMDQTGLSQKGGAVVSQVRGRRAKAPAANSLGEGRADVLMGFDPLSASESRHLEKLRPGATAVVQTTVTPTASMITQPFATIPSLDSLAEQIDAVCREVLRCDSQQLSEVVFGDNMPANVIALGAALQAGYLPVSASAMEAAIDSQGTAAAMNKAALQWGRAIIARPDLVAEVMGVTTTASALPKPSEHATEVATRLLGTSDIDGAAEEVASWRTADLVDYQSESYAQEYVELLQRVRAVERDVVGDDTRLSAAVAKYLYKLMAYKDEYEVARLHLLPEERERAREINPGAKFRFMLHPPLLRALGMNRKIAIPPLLALPMFWVLRGMRRVRGTWLDPFARAHVRRVERELVAEYRQAIETSLAALNPTTYESAVVIAEAPEFVRGYEGIKLKGAEKMRELLNSSDSRPLVESGSAQ